MTGITVNGYAAGIQPAGNTSPDARNTSGKSQDFGDILSRTASKTEQTGPDSRVRQAGRKEPYKEEAKTGGAAAPDAEQVSDSRELSGKDDPDTAASEGETASDVREEPAGSAVLDSEPVDEMTVEEIADALSRIIEQIREILGVTDEELLSGIETMGIEPLDLLDTADMAQLVTVVSGEDSPISLAANEELYAALQDIMQMVETETAGLMEKTGLTGDELDVVLEKLKDLENPDLTLQEQPIDIQSTDRQPIDMRFTDIRSAEEQPMDRQEGPAVSSGNPEETGNREQMPLPEEPADIGEDGIHRGNAESFPETPQQGSMENGAKPQTHRTGQDTDSKNEHDNTPGRFGQDQTLFQKNLNEVVNTAGENVQGFTSANTENILRQLADMVRIVRNENLTEMELQLHPASLGTVNVSLTTKGGVVTAEFTTQNETVKAAIEAQITQLRANLEEQGVRVEAIEVSVASHQMERNLDGNRQGQQQNGQEQRAGRVQGTRRNSINLNAFEDGSGLLEEMQGADDATRIAMEMMAANGNTMDVLV